MSNQSTYYNNTTRERTNISVSKITRDRLAKHGYAGMSLEQALIRLLDEKEGEKEIDIFSLIAQKTRRKMNHKLNLAHISEFSH